MKTKITFTLTAEIVGGATDGLLLGEFNDWDQSAGVKLKKSKDGSLSASVSLKAGQTYQYRYLLSDGRWVNDHNAQNQDDNCVVNVPAEVKQSSLPIKNDADDLTKIRGIGEKIAKLLVANGIDSFEALANSTFEKLREILDTTGARAKIYDPTHWTKQGKLAAAGKWDELKKLQADLKNGAVK